VAEKDADKDDDKDDGKGDDKGDETGDDFDSGSKLTDDEVTYSQRSLTPEQLKRRAQRQSEPFEQAEGGE
jgi:hypothetical protein